MLTVLRVPPALLALPGHKVRRVTRVRTALRASRALPVMTARLVLPGLRVQLRLLLVPRELQVLQAISV